MWAMRVVLAVLVLAALFAFKFAVSG